MKQDIHALSGAYAVDALDDHERAQFDTHLAGCSACRAEVQSFRETTALITELEAVAEAAPPASLRANVLAGISQVRPFPPETAPEETPAHSARVVTLPRRLMPTLVAAVTVLVLATAGVFAWHPWGSGQTTTLADQVLHAPDAVKVVEKIPGGKGELVLVRSASLGRAVMVGQDVAEPPNGETYQLWLQQPGRGMVSAGLMPDSHQATLLSGDSSTATAAAVSVEPAGGSVHPSKNVVAVFNLGSSSQTSGA